MNQYLTNADSDDLARLSIWNAIKFAAKTLLRAWEVHVYTGPKNNQEIYDINSIPTLPTWKLIEILSALAVLTNAEQVISKEIINIKSKTGPVEYIKNGKQMYLWTQPNMSGEESGLGGRPDIVITNTSRPPSHNNSIQIIESKCNKSLGTPIIRAEFAKGFDLRISSYFIWSFFTPPERLVHGAKKLGIDLTAIGFDTRERSDRLIPEELLYFVSNKIEASNTDAGFAKLLEMTANEASGKLLV